MVFTTVNLEKERKKKVTYIFKKNNFGSLSSQPLESICTILPQSFELVN